MRGFEQKFVQKSDSALQAVFDSFDIVELQFKKKIWAAKPVY